MVTFILTAEPASPLFFEAFLWGIILVGMLLMASLALYQFVLLRRGERSYGVGLRGPSAKGEFPRFPSDDEYAVVPAASS